jgi:hypothetical protein
VTQAAARTFALRLAELGDEFERGFHNLLQLHHNTATAHRDQLRGHRPINQCTASSPTPRR